jgi:hypothetical protein
MIQSGRQFPQEVFDNRIYASGETAKLNRHGLVREFVDLGGLQVDVLDHLMQLDMVAPEMPEQQANPDANHTDPERDQNASHGCKMSEASTDATPLTLLTSDRRRVTWRLSNLAKFVRGASACSRIDVIGSFAARNRVRGCGNAVTEMMPLDFGERCWWMRLTPAGIGPGLSIARGMGLSA